MPSRTKNPANGRPKRRKASKREILRRDAEWADLRLIRSWLALAPNKRTNFLRVKVGIVGTAL